MSGFYKRQTCLNGHITSNYIDAPFGTSQPFCAKCGAKTIVDCPACGAPQRGAAMDVVSLYKGPPDAYCRICGKPYPWTERQLQAVADLVEEEEKLSTEEKVVLTDALRDLMVDTPKTTLAATRFKRIVPRVGGAFKEAMYKFLVDFSSETAKKIVLGG